MLDRVNWRMGGLATLGLLAACGDKKQASVPPPDPAVPWVPPILAGEPPSPLAVPRGCRFHPRCPIAEARCRVEPPALRELGPGRRAACHLAG